MDASHPLSSMRKFHICNQIRLARLDRQKISQEEIAQSNINSSLAIAMRHVDKWQFHCLSFCDDPKIRPDQTYSLQVRRLVGVWAVRVGLLHINRFRGSELMESRVLGYHQSSWG